jgi:uncharacterized protein YndB with AHSA1/START domain
MRPDATAADIHRYLSATPEKVFAAFADPTMVSRWLTPSPDIRLEIVAFEFRESGSYRFAYHVPGGQVMRVNGVYRLIRPPSGIVFSWNIEPPDEHAGVKSEVIVRITADGEGSKLHIRHQQLTPVGAVERHREGWGGALDQLSHLLAEPEQRA